MISKEWDREVGENIEGEGGMMESELELEESQSWFITLSNKVEIVSERCAMIESMASLGSWSKICSMDYGQSEIKENRLIHHTTDIYSEWMVWMTSQQMLYPRLKYNIGALSDLDCSHSVFKNITLGNI